MESLICQQCRGVILNLRRSDAMYCSERCRSAGKKAKRPEHYKHREQTYYQKNRERKLKWQKAYDDAHPGEKLAREIARQKANPEMCAARARRRRARLLGASGDCSETQMALRATMFGCKCWICGGTWEADDHVIPLARGGTNWPANLRPICHRCNARKGGRDPWKFLTNQPQSLAKESVHAI